MPLVECDIIKYFFEGRFFLETVNHVSEYRPMPFFLTQTVSNPLLRVLFVTDTKQTHG